jgi:hypothetical protein
MSAIAVPPEPSIADGRKICWKSWPVGQPRQALKAAVGFASVGFSVFYVTASPTMAFLSLVVVGLAGWRMLVPVTFEADDGGVRQQWLRCRRYDSWNTYRAFSSSRDGFILWPHEACCPLDVTRGLFLPCSSHKADLSALLRRNLAEIS